jgi:hypothetical protein
VKFIHPFLSVLYLLSPSDWINVGVSLGTLALAEGVVRAHVTNKNQRLHPTTEILQGNAIHLFGDYRTVITMHVHIKLRDVTE